MKRISSLLSSIVPEDILLFVLLAIFSSCNNSDEPQQQRGGKRDYTWTIDTLWYSTPQFIDLQTLISAVWATSPTNVYVAGYSSYASIGVMYRYDGTKWERVRLHVSEGGLITGGFELNSIYGFGANDIWAVGQIGCPNPNPPPLLSDSSIIIHFDGTAWTEAPIQRGRELYTMWGAKPDDIWAGGDHGILYHYDGAAWTRFPFDTLFTFNSLSGINAADVYATCGKNIHPPYDSLQFFLFHNAGTQWTPVDSFMVTVDQPTWKFGLNLWSTQKLYAASFGVYSRNGNSWKELVISDRVLHVGGSSDDNIFAVGDFGRIYHWNGTDWKRFTEIEYPAILWNSVWTNNRETFIVGWDGLKSYVLHGK